MKFGLAAVPLTDVKDNINDGTWNRSPDFQRELVWSSKEESRLVESMRNGFPFGMITIMKIKKEFIVLDGKQRSTTIAKFLNDEIKDKQGNVFSQCTESERYRVP